MDQKKSAFSSKVCKCFLVNAFLHDLTIEISEQMHKLIKTSKKSKKTLTKMPNFNGQNDATDDATKQ